MSVRTRRSPQMRQDVHDAPDEGASSEESRREATRLLVLELLIRQLM